MQISQVTSLQNPRVKEYVTLAEKSRERRERGLFAVEGLREASHCLEGGFCPDTIFFCGDIISEEVVRSLFGDFDCDCFEVTSKVYAKLARRDSTEGIAALFVSKNRTLEELKLGENPFVIVLESVEKPGNLGAVLRTADAAGAAAVLVCDPLTDLYNPNVIRASLGGIFTVPTVACTSEEAAEWLHANGFQILTAQLQDSRPYYDIDMVRPTAIAFGTEADGLTEFWRSISDGKVIIPMAGKLDSLNVSVSVAILAYEAVRQKNIRN